MVVEKRKYVVKNIQKNSNNSNRYTFFYYGEMAEGFKAVDCKSIEFIFIVGSNPTFS